MPMTSAHFDAVLYGSPIFRRGGGFEKRYAEDGSDNMLLPVYQERVNSIGMYYLNSVKEAFAAKHGRTGETAKSMHSEFESFSETGVAGAMRYRVVIEGNVGFVINPLPAHFIPVQRVENLQTQRVGRQTNFYSPFDWLSVGDTTGVEWFQGGSESYGDDKSWYEDQLPELAAMGEEALKTTAARVRVLWDKDMSEAPVPLTAPSVWNP